MVILGDPARPSFMVVLGGFKIVLSGSDAGLAAEPGSRR
jgi:hypothetical protein